ncbi:MAG: molybdopterin molybdotransferase MoeA [Polyangiaceae bacterium]|nr:molybdopterin molybdotransferase MoeA [Polyangiaceae bacterium]
MLTVDEARARWLSGVPRLPAERVPIAASAGRVIATDVAAGLPLPLFDHSAMDGYAIASADCTGPAPFVLRFGGESRAGDPPAPHVRETARRIFTGAPLPAGADAVVMQEHVTREGESIRFVDPPRPGQHVRRAGEDVAGGAIALRAGTRVRPGTIALAAMIGRAEIAVARRPHVTILCTGDELLAPGEPLRPGAIPESNSAALGALAQQAGAVVRVAPIAADDEAVVIRAVRDALDGCDVLVTIGGVSVGDHDVVRPALEAAGVSLDFWKVAIKPGKPIAVGRRDGVHVLGLPGNPASALVTFVVFGMPLLRALQGDAMPSPLLLPARMATARKRSPDRVEYVRATLAAKGGPLVAVAHDNQASGAATSLAESDGLAVVAPGEDALPAGGAVDFLRWSDA